MKTLICFSVMLFFATGLIAQVPDNVKNKFSNTYPGAKQVIWSTVDKGLYKVAFDERGVSNTVVYDEDMNVVWRRNELMAGEIPAPIRDYFMTANPNDKDYEVLVIDEDGKKLYYSSKSDEKTVYLDEKGSVAKTVYHVETKEYPKTIGAYFSKKSPETKYTVYSIDENGMVSYYTIDKGKVLYFDKEGNFIREDYYYDYKETK